MKLYLHVGSHKTGTTAIQHFAAAHRGELAARGLLYPGFDLVGNRPQRSHLPLVRALHAPGSAENVRAEQVPEFLDQVRRRSEDLGLDVLLSAESLYRVNRSTRERLIGLLRSRLPEHEVVPVAVLRRQDDLADSLYRNYVRAETTPYRVPPAWEDYLAERPKLFRYDLTVRGLEDIAGHEALVLPYDRATKRQIIPAFFQALGVAVGDDPLPARRVNHSFDLIDCLVKIRLHDQGRPDRLFRRFERFVRAHPLRTEYSFFTDAARERFLESLAAGNQTLVRDRPELATVLDPEAPPHFPRQRDEHCEPLVEARLAQFEEFRKTRQHPGSGREPHGHEAAARTEQQPTAYPVVGTPGS